MKKKGKKSAKQGSDEGSQIGNVGEGTPEPQNKKKSSRLRRHRGGSSAPPESDSDPISDIGERRERRRRKKRSSRAQTATTEETSEDDDSPHRKGSKFTTEDERSKEKPKEITEKDLVERMQNMIPYLPSNSPLWTTWTLAPLYHFIRKQNASLVVALVVEHEMENGKNGTTSERKSRKKVGLKKSVISTTQNSVVLQRLLRICKPFNGKSLITFNEVIPDYTGELFYFSKAYPAKLDGFNWEEIVFFGNVPEDQLQAFNVLSTHLWTPLLLAEDFLPEGVQDEVYTDLNTMSCCTRSTTRLVESGHLVLHIPPESTREDRSELALSKDKQFCIRLEETIVFWLTKLKEILILKELNDTEGWPGPLEEIQFWKSRKDNFVQILQQMRSPGLTKLIRILLLSRSPYLPELEDISKEILKAYKESASNFQYLLVLQQPCEKLCQAKFKEIPAQMERFLWAILTIWKNSPFYNTSQRLNSLLRKFSNAVITECRKRVKILDILQGRVSAGEKMIKNCIKFMNWWKEKYERTETMYNSKCLEKEKWIFDYDHVFSHVDALILRMNNLLEICTVQKFYGRRKDDDSGEVEPLPLYPGSKGAQITKTMKVVEQMLSSKMVELAKVSHLILNVKSTEWHEHMDDFNKAIVMMEMTIQNLLETMFDQMSNLKQRLEFLKLFFKFYTRSIITRQIDKLAIRVYEYFEEEVLKLRKLFELKVVPLPNTYSQLAGRGAWAGYMKKRIESQLALVKEAEVWLPKSVFADSVKFEAKSLADAMGTFSRKMYEEWNSTEAELKDYMSKLEVPLLLRCGREKRNIVEVNFDRNVYRSLAEAEMWSRVGRAVPPILLLSIYPLRERLHLLKENVSLIAKHYNRIMSSLSRDEKLLFRQRLLPLENKIYPCLSSYNWLADPNTSSETADPTFVAEFQTLVSDVWTCIQAYRNANARIASIAAKISTKIMVKIDPNSVYEGDEFFLKQTGTIEKKLKRIVKSYKQISSILKALVTIFRDDGPEVAVQWGKYVNLIDDCIQEALCISLRNSLEILENSICHADKPIFKLEMKLDEGKIGFEPELEVLAGMIVGVHKNISMAVEPLSRLSEYLGSEGSCSSSESFAEAMMNDEVSLQIQERLQFAIGKCFSELNLYSERWTPYRDVWELDRGTFLENYERQEPSLSSHEKDLAKYLEISEVCHGSDSVVNICFVLLDCVPLKTGISERSEDWYNLLAKMLYEKGKSCLDNVYEYVASNKRKLSAQPSTLDDQMNCFKLAEALKIEAKEMRSKFPLNSERFQLLEKYKFKLESDVEERFQNLEREWKSYLRFLKETDINLQKSYDNLRTCFLERADNFKSRVNELISSYDKEGPFSAGTIPEKSKGSGCGYEKALNQLENYLNDVTALKQDEKELTESLKFFNETKEKHKGLISLGSEVDNLARVWRTVKQWHMRWEEWKLISIEEMPLEKMKDVGREFLTIFHSLNKEYETRSWPVISEQIEFLEIFQHSLETVQFLKTQTLRSRHWLKIGGIIGKSNEKFQLSRDKLNLEIVVNLRLHSHFHIISEISLASGKETAVEKTLSKIEDYWSGEIFTLLRRKGSLVLFEIGIGPNLQDVLMDHIVSLSAMKGSFYIDHFLEKIEHWEGSLSRANLILGKLLETQREWHFFESVFLNDDIRKEIPRQSKQFRVVTSLWASILLIITENRNIVSVLNLTENFSEMLDSLQEQLEKLRKDLEIWLLEKRQHFPRFYFIPNHDLLELLGNSRKPQNVLHVIRKLFSNVNQLEYSPEGKGKEISGIISSDGEILMLTKIVPILTTPLESWLEDLDNSIKSTVKFNLRHSLESLRQNVNRPPEEWILLWPGQSLLTSFQIQWTLDVTKVLLRSSTAETSTDHLYGDFTLKKLSKRLKRNVSKLTEKNANPNQELAAGDRLKLQMTLMTMLYLRDVTERLYLRNCNDLQSFEWLQYLRFYWDTDFPSEVVVRQGQACLQYGFEYLGNCERAVVTPITERYLVALTSAISFHFGAFIHGIGANIGKKETLQELGRQLGRHMVNLNLSKDTDYDHLNSVITGLVQTGSWGIFRNIESCQPEVISLVGDKLEIVMKAKVAHFNKMMLNGLEVTLNANCGVFLILKLGHEKQVELTRLKSLLRPVAMMQPDTKYILDVKLLIGGFENSGSLATKLDTLFAKARDLLCYQNRCSFSLKALLTVVTHSIELKRNFGKRLLEAEAVSKALQNIITPALSPDENQIFSSLLKQQFGLMSTTLKNEQGRLETAIRDAFKRLGYQTSEKQVKTCLKLNEILKNYKTVVLIGNTGTGKSVVRQVLKECLDETFDGPIKEYVINPAIFEPSDLLGASQSEGGFWKDGILTKILRNSEEAVGEYGSSPCWIIFDGVMPKSWAMDEGWLNNRGDESISLSNCDKLCVPDQVEVFIEVDELTNATPGMIAKAGVIYMSDDLNKWKLPLRSWLEDYRTSNLRRSEIASYATPLLEKCLEFSSATCSGHIPSSFGSLAKVQMFIRLMDSLVGEDLDYFDKLAEENVDKFNFVLKQAVLFSITWSIFGGLNEESEVKANTFLKDLDPKIFPSKGTVFDYYIDVCSQKWLKWSSLAGHSCASTPSLLRNRPIISSLDTVRSEYFWKRFQGHHHPILFVGGAASDSVQIIRTTLNSTIATPKERISMHVKMTPMMTGKSMQSLIETRLEPVSSFVLSPPRGKSLTIFVEDLNVSNWTDNVSYYEFLRNFTEHGILYDPDSAAPKAASNTFIIASTSSLSGRIPARLQSKFAVVYVPSPDEFQLRRIFTKVAVSKLEDFPPSVKLLGDSITIATLEMYKTISNEILPTPSKPLHVFSLRDISRVYDGLLRANNGIQNTKLCILRMWFHECMRTFHDRLLDQSSRLKCRNILEEQLLKHFEKTVESISPLGGFSIFGNFLNPKQCYEEIKNEVEVRRLIERCESTLKKDMGRRYAWRSTILFKEAIQQIARIARIISEPKGHIMNCGEAGQGRQTLSRLAAALYKFELVEPRSNSEEPLSTLVDSLRESYRVSGIDNRGCCIILKDELICSATLELISLATSSVEIPNLYSKQELTEIKRELGKCEGLSGADSASLLDHFWRRVEQNFHLILCANPFTTCFRRKVVLYSSLLNQMVVNIFDVWTRESYLEVAKILLQDPHKESKIPSTGNVLASGSIFYTFHSIACDMGEQILRCELAKFSSITPMHFITFVEQFNRLVKENTISNLETIKMLTNAMEEIARVRAQIGSLREQASNAEKKARVSRTECDKLHEILEKQETETNSQAKLVKEKSEQLDAELREYEELAEVIKLEWTSALEEFENSAVILRDLTEDDLTHLRAYYGAPPLVAKVMEAVMIMLDRDTKWAEVKIQIGHPDFIRNIVEFDKGRITSEKLAKLRKFLQNQEFTPDAVSKYSNGARVLCGWIHAIEKYGREFLSKISPKKRKLEDSDLSISENRQVVDLATQKLHLLRENLAEIQSNHETKSQLTEGLEEDSSKCSQLLTRAEQVLNLMGGDLSKWRAQVGELHAKFDSVSGDSLMAAACLNYFGPFPSELRREMKELWRIEVETGNELRIGIELSSDWNLEEFCGEKNGRLDIAIKGLPQSDECLLENMIILKRSLRCVIVVDPHNIASQVLRSKSKHNNGADFVIQSSGQGTRSVLEIYEHFLEKDSKNGEYCQRILITKHLDPALGQEITSRFSIVNFTLSRTGLTDYFVGKIGRQVNPDVESSRHTCFQTVFAETCSISELKEKIPKLIIGCGASILNDNEFPEMLRNWQNDIEAGERTLGEMGGQLHELEPSRQKFHSVASKMATFYETVCEIAMGVSPFYSMSLDFFETRMEKWIEMCLDTDLNSSRVGNWIEMVIRELDATSVQNMLRSFSWSMFQKDRYVFVLVLILKLLENQGIASFQEASWLLFTTSVDSNENAKNFQENATAAPTDSDDSLNWLRNALVKRKLKDLDKLDNFHGLLESVTQSEKTGWETWLEYYEPENKIPGIWASKLGNYEKLLLLSALRPDRVPSQIKILAEEILGKECVAACLDTPLVDLKHVYSETNCFTPVIFLMEDTSGMTMTMNPLSSVSALSKSLKSCENKLFSLPLSANNTELARKLIEEGLKEGYWVYFSNCHLSVEWMLQLEEIIMARKLLNEDKRGEEDRKVHSGFRLWLCTKSYQKMPLELVKSSFKIAVEPPQTLGKCIERLSKKMFNTSLITSSPSSSFHKNLLFGLSLLHSSLVGRHKFERCIPYSHGSLIVSDTDFEISSALLKMYENKHESYQEAPSWWVIKYMLELQYSSQSSSLSKQHIVETHIRKIFCEELVSERDFRRPSLTAPHIPAIPAQFGDLASFHRTTSSSSNYSSSEDNPEIYGIPASVGVALSEVEAKSMFASLERILVRRVSKLEMEEQEHSSQKTSSQGRDDAGAGMRMKHELKQDELHLDKALDKIGDLLDKLPKPVDDMNVRLKLVDVREDRGQLGSQSLFYVWLMETKCLNNLLETIKQCLENVKETICRHQLSIEATETLNSILLDRVPHSWLENDDPLQQSLESWLANLRKRWEPIEHFCSSAEVLPSSLWLGGFSQPGPFLAALLQKTSREKGIPVEQLIWRVKSPSVAGGAQQQHSFDEYENFGIQLEGLYLVGASWNEEKCCLKENSSPVANITKMPTITLVPTEIGKKSKSQNVYSSPCYKYHSKPIGFSEILRIGLNCGVETVEHWILREVALHVTNPLGL